MSICGECDKEECTNGDDCWYVDNHANGCGFCHCYDPEDGDDEIENNYSTNITIHNITRDQADAAVHAAVDAVEDLREDNQPRHDGTAVIDKTDRLLSSKEQKKLKGSDEDED